MMGTIYDIYNSKAFPKRAVMCHEVADENKQKALYESTENWVKTLKQKPLHV